MHIFVPLLKSYILLIWSIKIAINLTLLSLKLTYVDTVYTCVSPLKVTVVDRNTMYSSKTSFSFLKHQNISDIKEITANKIETVAFQKCIICHINLFKFIDKYHLQGLIWGHYEYSNIFKYSVLGMTYCHTFNYLAPSYDHLKGLMI